MNLNANPKDKNSKSILKNLENTKAKLDSIVFDKTQFKSINDGLYKYLKSEEVVISQRLTPNESVDFHKGQVEKLKKAMYVSAPIFNFKKKFSVQDISEEDV